MRVSHLLVLGAALLLPLPILAQDATATPTPATTAAVATSAPLPSQYQLGEIRFEWQQWNNCGPATITNALSYFGYEDNQSRAARWLKPHTEDKNVSPWQMADFVNTQVPEMNIYAKVRYGGTQERLKRLISNNFPVIIEKGYDPEPDRLGWMGHYLLMVGYDDAKGVFYTHDSYIGPNKTYSYENVADMWQDFNYVYIVLYPREREAELNAILGGDVDERENIVQALELARGEAIADNADAFAWFNMGANFTMLGMYNEAAIAFDQARSLGLPWRMMWYRFEPFEAYYRTGRYDDVLALSQANLSDGGGQYVEETYYYGGRARAAKGETERALTNYQNALDFNPNFTPAQEAIDELTGQQTSGN